MKCIKILLVASIMTIGIYSCTDDNVRIHSDTIIGKWRLVGTQISPGSPVPISAVPALPLQMLEFRSDSTVSSSLVGGSQLLSYSIHDDTIFHSKGLFLYSTVNPSNASTKGVYRFNIKLDTLRLGSMGCYEVCDEIFKRMN